MSTPIVIVPCGAKKQSTPCRADEMYIGSYHRACMYYARTLTTPDRIFILSAKYMLISLDTEIEPYERHMSENFHIVDSKRSLRGEVAALFTFQLFKEEVLQKAARSGRKVVLLGGRDYTDFLENFFIKVGCSVEVPLRGKGGLVAQQNWLREQIRARRVLA